MVTPSQVRSCRPVAASQFLLSRYRAGIPVDAPALGTNVRWKSISGYMLGTTYAQLHQNNPKLDKLLVDTMLGMCAQMMAMAAAFLGIAWFAARRGARWAPWVLLVSGVVWVPYYFVVASDFGAFGAKDTFMAAVTVSLFAIPAVIGAILMLAAPRQRLNHP
jgi:hypothetical protein